MACLFGYFGPPADGLLERMAALLGHRCTLGWERTRGNTATGETVEIGHGIATWNQDTQVARRADAVVGFGGVLFDTPFLHNQDGSVAERILATVEQQRQPESLLETLTGAFVVALHHHDALYLVRDPAGVKVLYWTVHRGRLLFASEIKALFADATLPRRMRAGALPEYLTFSFIPGTGTMFDGIEELQPGSILHFSQGRAQVRRHFCFETLETDTAQPGDYADDYPDQVRTALEESVAECLALCPDRLPAIFLSGGIDSSAVLAVAARQKPEAHFPTFSVHFGAEYARENDFVQLMVDRYHTDHHWLEIRPAGFLDHLRTIIWRLDDPIGDPVTIPNYLLAQTAVQASDRVLNGEGGDPCFGGPKNLPMLLARLYGPLPGEPTAGWLERNYLRAFQRCYQDLEPLLGTALLREAGGDAALIRLLEPFFQAERPRDFVNKLMAMNIRLKGANLILVKVEKMTAANGVLALPPLFSRRIIETSMRCPANSKLEGAVEKSVLKKAVQDLVPEPIIARPKSGMMVPVRFWFQGELRRYGETLLDRRQLQRHGFFNPDYVKRLLNYEMEGVPGLRHGLKLWMLITFLLWYEQMVDEPLPVQPVPVLRPMPPSAGQKG